MALNPDQILTFAVVADTGNISHAATLLHLSQPAVSGQLRALQEWFGEVLYRRSGQGIVLTPAGEQLAEQGRALRRNCERVAALRDAWQGLETGQLRLGASTTPASYLLPACVARFRREHGRIHVSMVDGNTREIVKRLPTLDLAFIEGAVPVDLPEDVSVHAWREDEVVAIVPRGHALARSGAVTVALADVAQEPLVMREPGSGVRALVERSFENAGLAPRVTLELAGVEGVKHAVRAGLGVGFVSALSMRHEDGSLIALAMGERAGSLAGRPGLFRTLSILAAHAGSGTRAASRFLEICLELP
jgi:DNA-binding transcriptional LysR family regulator